MSTPLSSILLDGSQQLIVKRIGEWKGEGRSFTKVNFAIQMWQLLSKSILWLPHHGNIEVKWWRKKFHKLFFMAKRLQGLNALPKNI